MGILNTLWGIYIFGIIIILMVALVGFYAEKGQFLSNYNLKGSWVLLACLLWPVFFLYYAVARPFYIMFVRDF